MRTPFAFALLASLIASEARAEKPPVKVEVVIDGDEDFWGEDTPAKKKKKQKSNSVEENADEMFDELEAEEARRGKTSAKANSSSAGNINTNTQVVKVVVVGDKVRSSEKTETKVATPPPVPATPETPEVPKATAQASTPPPKKTKQLTVQSRPHQAYSWWNDKPTPRAEDFLLYFIASDFQDTEMFGMGAEFYMTDTFGLRLDGVLNYFEGEGKTLQVNLSQYERVLIQNAQEGTVHQLNALLTAHLNPRSSWDWNISAGLSHVGYEASTGADHEAGGSLFATLGVGFAYHYKRLFMGLDVSWQPYEMARYTVDSTGTGRRRHDGALNESAIAEPWDPERITGSWRMGVRF